MAGDWTGDCTSRDLGLRWLPVPLEVISVAVRWYPRFGMSYRDVEELLAERGVTMDPSPSTAECSGSPRSHRGRPGCSASPAQRSSPASGSLTSTAPAARPSARRLSPDDAEHRVAAVGPGFRQLEPRGPQMRVDRGNDASLRRLVGDDDSGDQVQSITRCIVRWQARIRCGNTVGSMAD
jgi:hypothetical protein